MRRVPCTPLHTASPRSPRCFCARRLVDISEMRAEERRQPLEDGSILEFLVHGEFAYKDSDINSTYGAWWVPLRRRLELELLCAGESRVGFIFIIQKRSIQFWASLGEI